MPTGMPAISKEKARYLLFVAGRLVLVLVVGDAKGAVRR